MPYNLSLLFLDFCFPNYASLCYESDQILSTLLYHFPKCTIVMFIIDGAGC